MNKYIQIAPATDWYFKHDQTVWHVAAFALTEQGEAIGLIGAVKAGTLKSVPRQVNGMYLHRRQLTHEEIEAADKQR
jgi:hypothetical protein